MDGICVFISAVNKTNIEELRNVLISRFNSEHAPYKVSPIKITHKDRKI